MNHFLPTIIDKNRTKIVNAPMKEKNLVNYDKIMFVLFTYVLFQYEKLSDNVP